jgi:hypothetical protein
VKLVGAPAQDAPGHLGGLLERREVPGLVDGEQLCTGNRLAVALAGRAANSKAARQLIPAPTRLLVYLKVQ